MKTKFTLLSITATFIFSFNIKAQSFPSSWVSKGVGGGGAIVSAAISPYDGNNFFLTCDMSNLFHTADFGQTYSMIPFKQLQVQLKSEVQFTSNASKLFVLNKPGGGNYISSKSYDGGINWINATNPSTVSLYQYFASPYDTDQVVISDPQKIYFSNTENTPGGLSFPAVLNYPGSYGGHIAGVYFENKDTVYICSHDSLIRTFNGGVTWTNVSAGTYGIPANEHIISFKGAKQGNKWVFYCVTIQANSLPNIYNSSGRDCPQYKGIYKLSQGHTQWVSKGANLPNPSLDKGYLLALAKNDTSVIYVGGNSTSQTVTIGAIFKSTNCGNSFTNVFLHPAMFNTNANVTTGWGGKQLTSTKFVWNAVNYMLALAVDPNNSSKIICGDGMWAHSSIDNGLNWQQIYTDVSNNNAPSTLIQQSKKYKTSGLETTASYWLTWTNANSIFASYNDIVARRSTDGGQLWSFDIYGLDSSKINDVNMTVFNSSNGLMYAAVGEQPGSNGDYTDARILQFRGRISMSADSGKNWITLKRFSGKPVTSLALDPNSTNGMYATVVDILNGIGDVYHCVDIVSNPNVWIKLASPPRTEGRPLQIKVLNNGDLVSVYGARDNNPNNPSNAFTNSSGVFYSNNGGVSWTDVTPIGATKETVNVELDPNDVTQNTWLAFVGAKSTSSGVFRTTNKGTAWTNVYSGGVLSGSFHPTLLNELYICTESNGLQYATNTGSNSFSITPVASYPFRRPQKVFFNPYNLNEVWVSSFGNGFRMGSTNVTSVTKNNFVQKSNLMVYPNPTNDLLYFFEAQKDFKIYNMLGELVIQKSEESKFIATSNLIDGVYLLQSNNSVTKFIVKH